jgi:hypothetical protein
VIARSTGWTEDPPHDVGTLGRFVRNCSPRPVHGLQRRRMGPVSATTPRCADGSPGRAPRRTLAPACLRGVRRRSYPASVVAGARHYELAVWYPAAEGRDERGPRQEVPQAHHLRCSTSDAGTHGCRWARLRPPGPARRHGTERRNRDAGGGCLRVVAIPTITDFDSLHRFYTTRCSARETASWLAHAPAPGRPRHERPVGWCASRIIFTSSRTMSINSACFPPRAAGVADRAAGRLPDGARPQDLKAT